MAEVSATLGITAFGVPQNANGDGTTASVLRHIIEHKWQSPGVMDGGSVTGREDLKYHVSTGAGVCQRNPSDGYTELWWPDADTPAVPAGDTANPRIDVVWIRARTESDPANTLQIGVTTGVPNANPTPPAIPDGAIALGYRRMGAGANKTSGTTDWNDGRNVDYALLHGSSMGVIARVAENRKLTDAGSAGPANENKSPFLSHSFFFPVQRNVDARFFACVSTPEKGKNQSGVATVRFYLDGTDTAHLYTSRKIEYTENWVTYEVSTLFDSLPAGRHTVHVAMFKQQGSDFYVHYGTEANHDMGDDKYPGRVLRLFDMGIAK